MPQMIPNRAVLRMTSELGRVMSAARAREQAGERVLHLERGEPDFETPPHIVEALAAAARGGETHYPDQRGQAHALDVMVGDDRALGFKVATWAAANAAALQVTYVIFAGHIIDFRVAEPVWHRCRDPAGSCGRQHFRHVHISFA